jgi:hypothetical protein
MLRTRKPSDEVSRIGDHTIEQWMNAYTEEIRHHIPERPDFTSFLATLPLLEERGFGGIPELQRGVLASLGYRASDPQAQAFAEVAFWETLKRQNPQEFMRRLESMGRRLAEEGSGELIPPAIQAAYRSAGFNEDAFFVIPATEEQPRAPRPKEWPVIQQRLSELEHRFDADPDGKDLIAQLSHPLIAGFRLVHGRDGAVDRICELMGQEGIADAFNRFDRLLAAKDAHGIRELQAGLLRPRETETFESLRVPPQNVFAFLQAMYRHAGKAREA